MGFYIVRKWEAEKMARGKKKENGYKTGDCLSTAYGIRRTVSYDGVDLVVG